MARAQLAAVNGPPFNEQLNNNQLALEEIVKASDPPMLIENVNDVGTVVLWPGVQLKVMAAGEIDRHGIGTTLAITGMVKTGLFTWAEPSGPGATTTVTWPEPGPFATESPARLTVRIICGVADEVLVIVPEAVLPPLIISQLWLEVALKASGLATGPLAIKDSGMLAGVVTVTSQTDALNVGTLGDENTVGKLVCAAASILGVIGTPETWAAS